jgi:hypothetical protein
MKTVTKQLQIFMTRADEQSFSLALLAKFPRICFIDDNVWATSSPPVFPLINLCETKFVYLWNKEIVPEIEGLKRKEGIFDGPSSGIVVQFIRSIQEDNYLRSGSIAWGGCDNDPVYPFVKEVWKLLEKEATKNLVAVDPSDLHVINTAVPCYRVGKDAARWCQKGPRKLLKDRSTQNYYLPGTAVPAG